MTTYRIKNRRVVGGGTYFVVVDDKGQEPSGFEHGTLADANREIDRLAGTKAARHQVTTWATAGGWGWSCACGSSTRTGGYAPTQAAAYSHGERHVRRALRKEPANP